VVSEPRVHVKVQVTELSRHKTEPTATAWVEAWMDT
jgi:hypothetical protein